MFVWIVCVIGTRVSDARRRQTVAPPTATHLRSSWCKIFTAPTRHSILCTGFETGFEVEMEPQRN